jgi:hypothetical protein
LKTEKTETGKRRRTLISKRPQLKENLARPPLTVEQKYQSEAFHYVSSLTGTVERLEEIPLECTPKMRQPVKPRFKLGLEDLWKCLEGCSLGSSSRPLLMS